MMEELSIRVREKRGNVGIREAAKQAGISQATLSRVEAGKMPDLPTFMKLCAWLELDPNTLLGAKKSPSTAIGFSEATRQVFAHFRAKKVMDADTSLHLAKLIQAINKEL
jgi:transcriptional regulator with XRE-family HTH domain